jgi:hypothetical protein
MANQQIRESHYPALYIIIYFHIFRFSEEVLMLMTEMG